MSGRKREKVIPPSLDTVRGPFPTVTAAAAVGSATLEELARRKAVMWGDASKTTYYSLSDIALLENPDIIATAYDGGSVETWYRNGVIAVGSIDGKSWIVRDSMRGEYYFYRSRRRAYSDAVQLVARRPDGTPSVLTDRGERLATSPAPSTVAKTGIHDDTATVAGHVADDVRQVPIRSADVEAVLRGQPISGAGYRSLAAMFPDVAMRVYGIPLICIDTKRCLFASKTSLRSAFEWAGVAWPEGLEAYSKKSGTLAFGHLYIVGGWAEGEYEKELGRNPSRAAALSLAMDIAPTPYLPTLSYP
jgi:hypothetical protein